MTYDEKIARVQKIITDHNELVPADDRLDADKVIAALKKAGGTSDFALKACSFEDLQGVGLPKLMARQVARMFREETDEGDKPGLVTAKRAAGMTPKQLLAVYDVRDADNAVGKRLAELAKGKRCIVFTDDGAVDVEASAKLLGEIRDGDTEREFCGNPPRKTYRIGERPVELADEDPTRRGHALRGGNECGQTGRSWEGVSHEVRAFIYIAVHDTGEAKVNSMDDRHHVIDLAIEEDALAKLRTRYPATSVRFDYLKRLGELPKLKVPRGSMGGPAGRINDPFCRAANSR